MTINPPEPYGLRDVEALSASVAAISPAMSRVMRDIMHFERQRPISANNVARLAREMKDGTFLAGMPIFICELPDKRCFIVNGNHTLEAIYASGVTVPLVLVRKRVTSMEEAARAYAVLDIQKPRTWGDALRAVGFSDSIPLASLVNAAMTFVIGNFVDSEDDRSRAASRDLRMTMIPEYRAAAHVLADCLNGAPKHSARCLRRASIFSVALYTARYQPSFAAEFWGALVRDDGLKATDPQKALLRYAMNNSGTGSQARRDNVKAAVLAWNAAFRGRPLEYCKPNQVGSIFILGTPMHKGAQAE